MKHNNCYIYPKSMRETIDGKRHYNTGKEKLPSVTTILSATQEQSKTDSLQAWRDRVGDENATRIVDSAAARGTAMHKILEKYIDESGYLDLTNVGKEAHNMAIRVIEQGLCNLTEYYGLECTLYYPGLYQEFIIEGEEFKKYQHKWLGRVSQYYEQRTKLERKNEEVVQSN